MQNFNSKLKPLDFSGFDRLSLEEHFYLPPPLIHLQGLLSLSKDDPRRFDTTIR